MPHDAVALFRDDIFKKIVTLMSSRLQLVGHWLAARGSATSGTFYFRHLERLDIIISRGASWLPAYFSRQADRAPKFQGPSFAPLRFLAMIISLGATLVMEGAARALA